MLNPASRIIRALGGHAAVASGVGRSLSRVYRWTYPVERGGTGGLIPLRQQARLLVLAGEIGVPLKPDDFFRDIGTADIDAAESGDARVKVAA